MIPKMEIKKYYKGLREFENYEENPFFEEMIQHIDKGDKMIFMTNKKPDYIVSSDGEVKGHTYLGQKKIVDKAEFTKIFNKAIPAFFDLSVHGIKIFGYIASHILPNKDVFLFDLDECMKYTGYKTKKSINTGLSELISNRFIARSNQSNKYFINGSIFFNGSRLTILHDYEVENNKNDKVTIKGEDNLLM